MSTQRITQLLADIRYRDEDRFELVQAPSTSPWNSVRVHPCRTRTGRWRAQASCVATSNWRRFRIFPPNTSTNTWSWRYRPAPPPKTNGACWREISAYTPTPRYG